MAELTNKGTLYVVATPIGNLEDITFRAVRVLREADLIACEDTRHTARLLTHYGIDRPVVSYHEHNEAARSAELVKELERGRNVALVSDAGMPGISDPGYRVIRSAIERNISVVPVPGPSALVSALAAGGLATESFEFHGFLPARSGARRSALEALSPSQNTIVLYEAPHRIAETLHDVVEVLGADRPVVLARELTKVHEEFIRGSAASVLEQLGRRNIKGEITLLIGKGPERADQPVRPGTVAERVAEIMAHQHLDEGAALKLAARERGMSKSEAYRELQRARKKK